MQRVQCSRHCIAVRWCLYHGRSPLHCRPATELSKIDVLQVIRQQLSLDTQAREIACPSQHCLLQGRSSSRLGAVLDISDWLAERNIAARLAYNYEGTSIPAQGPVRVSTAVHDLEQANLEAARAACCPHPDAPKREHQRARILETWKQVPTPWCSMQWCCACFLLYGVL